jgi:acyl-coenzyme A thioesterase PaaI-like protein
MSKQSERRAGIEVLAAAVRGLADAAAETAVDAETLAEVTATINGLTETLRAEIDDTPYSGLVVERDYSIPEGPMPLNPVIGACNPTRPQVQLRFGDGEVAGTATLSKRFVGPPGYAHGGISAMLADQIVAVSPMAIGERTITKALHVRYRRPLPLNEPVALWGVCDVDGDTITARYTITARGEVAVDGTAELTRYERLARRTG